MTAADLLFVNGTVCTMTEADPPARAVAVTGDRITAVGAETDVRAVAGPATTVVDLDGGALMPGINDSHLHAAMLGAYWPESWLGSLAAGDGLPTPRTLSTDDDRRAALRRAWDVLMALGITSYTEPGLGPGARGQHGGSCDDDTLRVYAELATAGELPVRVTALLLFGELDGASDPRALLAGLRSHQPDRATGPVMWRAAGVKLFADGIPPMRTAWLHEPYLDGDCGGLLVEGRDDDHRLAGLREMIRAAHDAGCQIGVHATGDRAVAESVRAFAAATAADRADLRHYVIHGDLIDANTLTLMSRAGVGLNAQPRIRDATAELLTAVLGADRAEHAVPLRSALAAGVPLCLSSDGPVLLPDWRRDVAAAALRSRSAGGDERIGIEAGLRAYTVTPAWQDHAESWKGTVEVGKVADLCVLDRNPLTTPAEELHDVQVRMTVVAGRTVFTADADRRMPVHRA